MVHEACLSTHVVGSANVQLCNHVSVEGTRCSVERFYIIQLFPLAFSPTRLMIPLAHPQNSGPLETNCVCWYVY